MARCDLRDIAEYTLEKWGETQRTAYIQSIDVRVRELSENPGRWRYRKDLFEGCQVAPVGQHLIIFIAKEDVILVSRVLHRSMDFQRHIFPSR